MTSHRFTATMHSICIALIMIICLSTATGVRAADPSTNLEHSTDAVVTSPNAAFARIENGICELLTTKTVVTGHDVHTAQLSGGETCDRVTDTGETTITFRTRPVGAATASKYSSMTPEQLGAVMLSGGYTDSWTAWFTSGTIQLYLQMSYDKSTYSTPYMVFYRPVSTSGEIVYLDATVVATNAVLSLTCQGWTYSSPTPSARISTSLTPYIQSQGYQYPLRSQMYSLIANRTCWYYLSQSPSLMAPRWTVTMKRGTGTPWTVYLDYIYGMPSA